MLRPPNFFLIAAAFGTRGGVIVATSDSAVAAVASVLAVPALPAAAIASEATRAKAPMDPDDGK